MEDNKEQKVLELKQKLSELRLKHKKQSNADFWKSLIFGVGGSLILTGIADKIGMLLNSSASLILTSFITAVGVMANIGASIYLCNKKLYMKFTFFK